MKDKIRWMYEKLGEKELYSKDMVCGYSFWKLVHTDHGGYNENEVSVYWHSDGAISFSGDGDGAFIYLYPEQAKQVLLAMHNYKEILK
jgi:hypothetical protein